MTHQRASQRKNAGVEGSGLAPVTLSKNFGEEEDIMEIESPTQSLKKLLDEKTRTKGVAHEKRARDLTMKSPSNKAPAEESASMHQVKFKF